MKLLTTNRLVLRHYEAADEEPLAAMFADDQVMRLVLRQRKYSRIEYLEFVATYLANSETHELSFNTLCLKTMNGTAGDVMGCAGIIDFECMGFEQERELGFILAKDFWRHGYASEIGVKLIQHGFDDLGLHRLLATVHPTNVGSIAVLERKLQMTLIDELQIPERGPRLLYSIPRPVDQPKSAPTVAHTDDTLEITDAPDSTKRLQSD